MPSYRPLVVIEGDIVRLQPGDSIDPAVLGTTKTIVPLNVTANGQTSFTLPAVITDPHLSDLIYYGLEATYGTDYVINGTTLTWSGNPSLEAGEKLKLSYFIPSSGNSGGGGSPTVPIGSSPTVVYANFTGQAGVTLAGASGSSITFAPIATSTGSPVEMELTLTGVVVAVVSFPSNYLSPTRAISYYHSPNAVTYSGTFTSPSLALT